MKLLSYRLHLLSPCLGTFLSFAPVLQRTSQPSGPEAVVDSIAYDLPLFLQMKCLTLFACSRLVVSFKTESCVGQAGCWLVVRVLKGLPLPCFPL